MTKHYKMRTNPSILLRQGVSQCGVSLFPVQDLALSTDEALPVYNRCAVHALVAAYLNLICQLTTVPAFCQHIHEVCVWASLCVCVLMLFVYALTFSLPFR